MNRRGFILFAFCMASRLLAQRADPRKPGDDRPESYRENEVASKVRATIAEQLEIEEDRVRDSASFEKDLGADSLDLAEIVMALEEEFAIEISDAETDKLLKVGDAIDCVKKHLRAANRLA
jgi:acyl carrier protein